jgi:hypothetical protein
MVVFMKIINSFAHMKTRMLYIWLWRGLNNYAVRTAI